ncbi:oligomeric complex COG6 [Testicularia cyperi]|uniref:Conserved oligomeric Golgi complex subunit 6 n=1 Tax=Testicularia cyperi TaxID=1882483 RepID=A0A317XRE1_9BASI|nr:oligomeric complex COG6 [Testicularia cyperi]
MLGERTLAEESWGRDIGRPSIWWSTPSLSLLTMSLDSTASTSVLSPSGSAGSHPISQRVRSVLLQSSHHDETDFKLALDTLANMYRCDASPSAGVSVKDKARSDTEPGAQTARFGDSDLIDTESARSRLDKDAARVMSSATNEIIAILSQVDQALLRLSDDVAVMHSSCDAVHEKLVNADITSRYLVEHAEGLQRQRDSAETQAEISRLFLQRFTLSDRERALLYSKELRVGQDHFEVMDKLTRIRKECQILLQEAETSLSASSTSSTAASSSTKAGLDIMRSTSEDLEQAYQKLYKWCSFEFRQPIKEGLEVSRSLREAVFRLKMARQDLLRSALSTLTQTRSSILANAFMAALTVGAGPPTYLPGPIERHAHDPMRYVGDMLAWIHQTVASEREFLTSLFGEKEGEGGRRIGQRRRGLEGSVDLTNASDPETLLLGPGEALVREVLNQNLDGCCRPLKIRVQQTLRSQDGSVTTYRLAHLVHFYCQTMERTIGTRASLSKALGELAQLGLAAFLETLDRQRRGLERYEDMPDVNLLPPPPVLATTGTLKELLSEYSRSLVDDGSGNATGTNASAAVMNQASQTKVTVKAVSLQDFDFVLEGLVDPMVALWERMASLLVAKRGWGVAEGEARWASLIFTLNCLDHVLSLLSPFTFAQAKTDQLQQAQNANAEQLVETHFSDLAVSSGLSACLDAVDAPRQSPLASTPGCTPHDLEVASTRLESWLASEDLMTPRRLSKLSSPMQRASVHQRALQRLTDGYGVLLAAIQSSDSGYESTGLPFRRSRDEISILLGL